MSKQPAVYIMASARNGTHEGFTSDHGMRSLVYFEMHASMTEAVRREKQLEKWNRAWKIELIERANPAWGPMSGSPLSRG